MNKSRLGTFIICFFLFLVFFVFMFPYKNLRGMIFGKIYAATKILIVADDIYPSFFGWPGIGIKGVNITLPVENSEIELAAHKVLFRVGLGNLFPPAPSVSLNMKRLKKGGDLYIRFVKADPMLKIGLEADEVSLDQLGLSGAPAAFSGHLDSDISLSLDQKDFSKSTGEIAIQGNDIQTAAQTVQMSETYSFLVPEMNIGRILAKILIKNGSIDFSDFKIGSETSDLSGSLTGDARLGQNYQSTRINLTLRLKLSNKILQNPQAKTFVSFLEGYQATPGNYAMRWNAAISDFTNLSINALPQRVN